MNAMFKGTVVHLWNNQVEEINTGYQTYLQFTPLFRGEVEKENNLRVLLELFKEFNSPVQRVEICNENIMKPGTENQVTTLIVFENERKLLIRESYRTNQPISGERTEYQVNLNHIVEHWADNRLDNITVACLKIFGYQNNNFFLQAKELLDKKQDIYRIVIDSIQTAFFDMDNNQLTLQTSNSTHLQFADSVFVYPLDDKQVSPNFHVEIEFNGNYANIIDFIFRNAVDLWWARRVLSDANHESEGTPFTLEFKYKNGAYRKSLTDEEYLDLLWHVVFHFDTNAIIHARK